MNNQNHKGQVALVLVLVMTVVSALAVSLASRSTIDTRIQQTESESVQAILNAQTGLEQAIMNPDVTTGTISDNTTYTASIASEGSSNLVVSRVEVGGTVELNLTGADFVNLNGFRVDWSPDVGNPGGHPALFVSVVMNTGSIQDYAYDYTADNGFTAAYSGSDGYEFSTDNIGLSSGVIGVRITVLRTAAKIRVVPLGTSAVFPPQVKSVKSVGKTGSGQGVTGSTVKYGLQYDESLNDTVPAVFEYALFSNGTIIQ